VKRLQLKYSKILKRSAQPKAWAKIVALLNYASASTSVSASQTASPYSAEYTATYTAAASVPNSPEYTAAGNISVRKAETATNGAPVPNSDYYNPAEGSIALIRTQRPGHRVAPDAKLF